MKEEELDKAKSMFICDRINFKDRHKGHKGMEVSNRYVNLLKAMDPKNNIDWSFVKSVQCHLYYDNIYTIDNITKYWKYACDIVKFYGFKMIYQIGCTVFVVSPNSNPDMMDELIDKPSFFKNYGYSDYFIHSKFEDFECNADIVIKMGLKQVGPDSMPRITKQLFEYMDNSCAFKIRVKRLREEIESEYRYIAEEMFKTYDRLGGKDDVVDRKELTGLSAANLTMANQLWHVMNAMFSNYQYCNNRIADTMMSTNVFDVVLEQMNFIIKYYVKKKFNDKSINCIINALVEVCANTGMVSDPWIELEHEYWDDDSYIEKVCKKLVNN